MTHAIAQLKTENQQIKNQLFQKEKQYQAIHKQYTDYQPRLEKTSEENG